MTNIPNDKRNLPYGSAFSIQDERTVKLLNNPLDLSVFNNEDVIETFLEKYKKWIKTTSLNYIHNLDDFKYACYSNGTTESFDKFYLKHSNRRFRCFKGEYMYHKLAWRQGFNWCYIEDDKLQKNDAVIVSLPFANTGNEHIQLDKLMYTCTELDIPVLLDCAYFGICSDIKFDFSYPCIKEIVFSLSKTFPVSYARIGMRLTREDDDDTLFVYQKINYVNRLGPLLGIRYLDSFSPDYIVRKYKNIQKEFCKELEVLQSKTVLFGLGDERWKAYNRGSIENRLSFHRQFITGLPK